MSKEFIHKKGDDHVHEWVGQGLVRTQKRQASPCSIYDDTLYTHVRCVQSCTCGAVRSIPIANENIRRYGDDLRRAEGRAPLARRGV